MKIQNEVFVADELFFTQFTDQIRSEIAGLTDLQQVFNLLNDPVKYVKSVPLQRTINNLFHPACKYKSMLKDIACQFAEVKLMLAVHSVFILAVIIEIYRNYSKQLSSSQHKSLQVKITKLLSDINNERIIQSHETSIQLFIYTKVLALLSIDHFKKDSIFEKMLLKQTKKILYNIIDHLNYTPIARSKNNLLYLVNHINDQIKDKKMLIRLIISSKNYLNKLIDYKYKMRALVHLLQAWEKSQAAITLADLHWLKNTFNLLEEETTAVKLIWLACVDFFGWVKGRTAIEIAMFAMSCILFISFSYMAASKIKMLKQLSEQNEILLDSAKSHKIAIQLDTMRLIIKILCGCLFLLPGSIMLVWMQYFFDLASAKNNLNNLPSWVDELEQKLIKLSTVAEDDTIVPTIAEAEQAPTITSILALTLEREDLPALPKNLLLDYESVSTNLVTILASMNQLQDKFDKKFRMLNEMRVYCKTKALKMSRDRAIDEINDYKDKKLPNEIITINLLTKQISNEIVQLKSDSNEAKLYTHYRDRLTYYRASVRDASINLKKFEKYIAGDKGHFHTFTFNIKKQPSNVQEKKCAAAKTSPTMGAVSQMRIMENKVIESQDSELSSNKKLIETSSVTLTNSSDSRIQNSCSSSNIYQESSQSYAMITGSTGSRANNAPPLKEETLRTKIINEHCIIISGIINLIDSNEFPTKNIPYIQHVLQYYLFRMLVELNNEEFARRRDIHEVMRQFRNNIIHQSINDEELVKFCRIYCNHESEGELNETAIADSEFYKNLQKSDCFVICPTIQIENELKAISEIYSGISYPRNSQFLSYYAANPIEAAILKMAFTRIGEIAARLCDNYIERVPKNNRYSLFKAQLTKPEKQYWNFLCECQKCLRNTVSHQSDVDSYELETVYAVIDITADKLINLILDALKKLQELQLLESIQVKLANFLSTHQTDQSRQKGKEPMF